MTYDLIDPEDFDHDTLAVCALHLSRAPCRETASGSHPWHTSNPLVAEAATAYRTGGPATRV